MGFVNGIARVHVLDSKHYRADTDKIPIGKGRRDDSTYMQCSMVLGPVDVRREVNRIIQDIKIRIHIMEDVSGIPVFSMPKARHGMRKTHEVNLRLESAALRSLTCAFCVALNWVLSWSRRVNNLLSATSLT